MALKERKPDVKIALADPMGAALYSYYTTGELKSAGSSITEGIGQGRITANLEGAPIDVAYQITDEEALPIVFDLPSTRACCSAARRASTSPARSASPASSDPATRS